MENGKQQQRMRGKQSERGAGRLKLALGQGSEQLVARCGANSIVVVVIRLNPVTDTGHYLMPCALCCCSGVGGKEWRGEEAEGWGPQFFVNLSAARAACCPS